MDVLPSAVDAARMLGLTLTHPLVFLARVLQATSSQVEDCTNQGVMMAVTLSRVGMQNGVLLFASGYLDPLVQLTPSAQALSQMTVGVDSLVTALRQLRLERQGHDEEESYMADADAQGTANENDAPRNLDGVSDEVEDEFDDTDPLDSSAGVFDNAAAAEMDQSQPFGETFRASTPPAPALEGSLPTASSPRRSRHVGLPPLPAPPSGRLPQDAATLSSTTPVRLSQGAPRWSPRPGRPSRGASPSPTRPPIGPPQVSPPLRSPTPDGRSTSGAPVENAARRVVS